MSLIGARVVRKEDPNLLTGRGTFVDDVQLHGAATMAFVRSLEPHARITGIDTSAAEELPGVLAVWTAEHVADLPPCPGLPGLERPLLAKDKVRFVGEPVAVVVAEDRYVASDAVEQVMVDYEPLPAAASIGAASRRTAHPCSSRSSARTSSSPTRGPTTSPRCSSPRHGRHRCTS